MKPPPMEMELKLDLDGTAALTAREGLVDAFGRPAGEHHLVSTYFDTAAQDLWKAGVTFRVRKDGERCVQTIKAENGKAAGLFSRPEWERDISGEAPNLDAPTGALLSMLTGVPIHRNALSARFTSDIERRLWRIERDGADLELASDEGAIHGNGQAITIHDLEIELKRGSSAALFHLAAEIGETIPLRIGVQSKAERGHALGAGDDHGLKAEPIVLACDLTAATGFQAIGQACLRHYRLNETRLLLAPHPESLHQCRVALRRLRSALSLFKPLLGDPESKAIGERLREAAKMFSDGRNIDVLIGRVDSAALAAKLASRRERIYAELLAGLRSAAFRALMLDLMAWINAGAWLSKADTEDRDRPIQGYAIHRLHRCRRRLKRRGKHLARLDAAHRHRARITAKKLRYAAEFFGGLFPGKRAISLRTSFLQAIESLQTKLGNLNDEATGAEMLKRLGLGDNMPDGRAHRPNSHALKGATSAYRALVDLKPFWA